MSLCTCSVRVPFCSNPAKHVPIHLLYGLCKPDLCLLVLVGVENTKRHHSRRLFIQMSQVGWPSWPWYWVTTANTVVHQGCRLVYQHAFERQNHETTWLMHKKKFEGTFHPFLIVIRDIKIPFSCVFSL